MDAMKCSEDSESCDDDDDDDPDDEVDVQEIPSDETSVWWSESIGQAFRLAPGKPREPAKQPVVNYDGFACFRWADGFE